MIKLAFIDICDTLFYSNTTYDFFTNNNRYKYLNNFFIKKANILLTKLIRKDFFRCYLIRSLKGKSKDSLNENVELFYSKYLQNRKIEKVHDIVSYLRSDGFDIILLSNTLDFIAKCIGENMGVNSYYASELLYDKDGYCLGKLNNHIQGNKHLVAKKILEKYADSGSANIEVYVITDNKTDLELIKMAKKAIVVSTVKNIKFWQKNLKHDFFAIIK